MKHFEVYTIYGSVIVDAEKVERLSVNDRPSKIAFITDDEIVAEFYCQRISGWVERRNDDEKQIK